MSQRLHYCILVVNIIVEVSAFFGNIHILWILSAFRGNIHVPWMLSAFCGYICITIIDQFSSVIDHISPSQIDSILNQSRSVIVRDVYNFCTIQSVPAAYQIKALIIIYPTVLSDLMVYIVSIKCILRLVNRCKLFVFARTELHRRQILISKAVAGNVFPWLLVHIVPSDVHTL